MLADQYRPQLGQPVGRSQNRLAVGDRERDLVPRARAALELGLATCGGAYGGLTWLAFGQVVAPGVEAVVMGPTVIGESQWSMGGVGKWIQARAR